MKFRTAFQVNSHQEPQHQFNEHTVLPITMAFKIPGLRRKTSKYPWVDGNALACNDIARNSIERNFNPPQPPVASKKQAMRDFFSSLRPKDQNSVTCVRHSGGGSGVNYKVTMGGGRKKSGRVAKPSSKRNSQIRSGNISHDVIERLMGPQKEVLSVRRRSDATTVTRQRSVEPSSMISPPPATSSDSQAEGDRKLLSAAELEAMFRGAPYFSVDQKTSMPRVIFREAGKELVVEQGMDHLGGFEHESFAGSTSGAVSMEVPNMLSGNGLDAGTVGMEYFIQLSSLEGATDTVWEEKARMEQQRLMILSPEKLGLRELDIEAITERLVTLDELYVDLKAAKGGWQDNVVENSDEVEDHTDEKEKPWFEDSIEEMGEELFARLLDSEHAAAGDVTLKAQVEALQKVLDRAYLWYDFSKPETRLRVGRILFGAESETTLEDRQQPTERDMLLFQITLAIELFVRVRASEKLDLSSLISDTELAELKARRTIKVTWDLLLAERFLDNMVIAANEGNRRRNRISTISAISYFTAVETLEDVQPILRFKNEARQRAGLVHFAEALKWSHLDGVEAAGVVDIATQEEDDVETPGSGRLSLPTPARNRPFSAVSGMSVYTTAQASPALPLSATFTIQSTVTFVSATLDQQHAVGSPTIVIDSLMNEDTAQTSTIDPTKLKIEPWVSQSWLSGLVLPGDSNSHLLMAALLEGSPEAIWTLQDVANLGGGFMYQDRAFWSKQSIVGRVLAVATDVKECMNWISMPGSLFADRKDGWLDVATPKDDGKPHVAIKDFVGKASDPLHGAIATSIQAGDFTTPMDTPPVMGNDVKLDGLSFTTSASGGPATAQVTFTSPINTRLEPLVVALTHNVYFIASYPCKPPTTPASRSYRSQNFSRASSSATSRPIPRPLATGPRRVISGLALSSRPNTFYEATSSAAQSRNTLVSSHALHTTPSSIAVRPATTYGAVSLSPLRSNPPGESSMRRPASSLFTERTEDPAEAPPLTPATPSRSPSQKPNPKDSAHSSQTPSRTHSSSDLLAKPPPATAGAHPLHIDFNYLVLPVAIFLTLPPQQSGQIGQAEGNEVRVLDCRGAADLEVLARAWCSMTGQNAIVGKSGRTCLGCCVREARGLGVGVVIRV